MGRPKGGVPWNKGKKFPQFSGENNHNWKGDSVKYMGLHSWLKRNFGNLPYCEKCNLQGSKQNGRWNIQWALIKGCKYERKRENFIGLCVSCHKFYDFTEETRTKLSLSHMGQAAWCKGFKLPFKERPWQKGKPAWNKGLKGVQVAWNKGTKGMHLSPKSEFKKGQKSWNKGLKTPLEVRLKQSISRKKYLELIKVA